MNIYVVADYVEFEGWGEPEAAFTKKADAEHYAKNRKAACPLREMTYWVQELELQGELPASRDIHNTLKTLLTATSQGAFLTREGQSIVKKLIEDTKPQE